MQRDARGGCSRAQVDSSARHPHDFTGTCSVLLVRRPLVRRPPQQDIQPSTPRGPLRLPAVETTSDSLDSFYVPDQDIWPREDLLDAWQMPGAPTPTQPTQDDPAESTPLHPRHVLTIQRTVSCFFLISLSRRGRRSRFRTLQVHSILCCSCLIFLLNRCV